MRILRWFLVHFGLKDCCDQQKLKVRVEVGEYFEYDCESCGYTYRSHTIGWLP